ncbi:DUF3492 domain-containing protein [Corynebacterium sp. CCM 8864]|uniref:DUF3492 domain-containing protein n=1 Tax=Corynebacterium marambiense TaxID=2765364 RepID=A0ABS0VRK2_9CORY|nr:DUF3492 domain-containing protein [Corynebacterium marambiense]
MGVRECRRVVSESSFELDSVDVAIVMESTYPFLKGGVPVVVYDISTHNPDFAYVIHIV